MKNYIKMVGIMLAGILLFDFMGFVAWILSGQYPVDGFYIGRITVEIIKLIIKII